MKTISLTQGYVAIVDDEDYDMLSQHSWCAHMPTVKSRRTYARRDIYVDGKCVHIWMHHVVLAVPPDGMVIDHIDLNGLNNQKHNLRYATQSQNAVHRPRRSANEYRGITRKGNRYAAQISDPYGNKLHLGMFATQRDAAMAYDDMATFFYKEFALLNFPVDTNA